MWQAGRPTPSVVTFRWGVLGLFFLGYGGIVHAAGAEPLTSGQIQGRWASNCAADLPASIAFGSTGAEVAGSSGVLNCRTVNARALSKARWYLDLECRDGSLLQLDVYLVAADELLLARRPLGEACRYKREPG